jgi:hypothetical protein
MYSLAVKSGASIISYLAWAKEPLARKDTTDRAGSQVVCVCPILFAVHTFHGIIEPTVAFPPRLTEAYAGPQDTRRTGER